MSGSYENSEYEEPPELVLFSKEIRQINAYNPMCRSASMKDTNKNLRVRNKSKRNNRSEL